MDSNPHRKPYDETTRKYWRDWYNSMNPEEKKEFNSKRYLRAKALKLERATKQALKAQKKALDVVNQFTEPEPAEQVKDILP